MLPAVREFRVRGLCAATYTAFHDDGSLNLDAIDAQIVELKRGGVGYVFVAGTTGEGYCLTIAERKTLLEAWIAKAQPDITVIAHIGCEALADVVDLAKHAKVSGAAAISVMPSVFFKPASIEILIKWLADVAAAVPDLPLYYYHIAIMTGVNFRMDKFLEAIHGRIPTFRGLKYSDADLHVYANCVAFQDGLYDVLYGKDEQLLGALAMGCTGAVGSTYNYMGATYIRLMDAFKRGDMAAALTEQQKSQLGVNLLSSTKYGDAVNVGKAILVAKGVPIGPPRLPKLPMSPEGQTALVADLTKLDFFGW